MKILIISWIFFALGFCLLYLLMVIDEKEKKIIKYRNKSIYYQKKLYEDYKNILERR